MSKNRKYEPFIKIFLTYEKSKHLRVRFPTRRQSKIREDSYKVCLLFQSCHFNDKAGAANGKFQVHISKVYILVHI